MQWEAYVLQKAVLQEGHFHVVTAGAQARENFLSHLHLNAHYKEKLPNQFHLKTSASDACSKTAMYQTGSNTCIIQNTKLTILTTSVGFAAPHLRILQVLRNAKLELPHFGHNQSPSDIPSGPADNTRGHSMTKHQHLWWFDATWTKLDS